MIVTTNKITVQNLTHKTLTLREYLGLVQNAHVCL